MTVPCTISPFLIVFTESSSICSKLNSDMFLNLLNNFLWGAIDLIIHKGRVGEVYNVGGHNEMKNIDIVKLICKELGKPESLITHVADRKGHDMRYAIDPTKIHNELGWLPETKFADGIKKTIKWYLDNKEWWETIISGEYQNYYEKMYGNREEVKA